ncbi:hypothetical protein NPIL_656051 [Nephila pilipes]|uniref:Uncharacterized protein n=1 Tax=Nephila pilipes TaxID=299642 RepID=A0A8X6U6L5_NEPPI|nr:hypothetical protein NPIL_656051 [Nephila pilipes]
MDPTRRGRKRKLYEMEQECSLSEASSFESVSEPENKRVAFTAEDSELAPLMHPRKKVLTWIEKNLLWPEVSEPDSPGSVENPSSPNPSTSAYYSFFPEHNSSPVATRDNLTVYGSDTSYFRGRNSISHTTGSIEEFLLFFTTEMADEEPIEASTEMSDEQPMPTSTEMDVEQSAHTSTEMDDEQAMRTWTEMDDKQPMNTSKEMTYEQPIQAMTKVANVEPMQVDE